MNTTKTTTKCDRQNCTETAVWAYTVNTLYGVETWNSCQPHTHEVRELNGPAVAAVKRI